MLKTALSHEIKGKKRRSNCLDRIKVPPLTIKGATFV